MQQYQQQVIQWLSNNIWTVLVLASLFIQITPIKINPWTSLFQWIGKTITGNACSKIDNVIEKINCIETEVRNNEKDRIRWEILDFANSCHNGRKHTKDEYRHIDKLNRKYIQLLQETDDSNGEFEAEYEYIQELYAERIRKNDFLENREGISHD